MGTTCERKSPPPAAPPFPRLTLSRSTGSIPADLEALTEVRILKLGRNPISGTLPKMAFKHVIQYKPPSAPSPSRGSHVAQIQLQLLRPQRALPRYV